MSSEENGDRSAVSNSLTRTVTAASNATPIVVTTSVPHGFASADDVVVAAVGGNTAANGTWAIVVLSATTFSLVGSAGSGAYTSGGTAENISLMPRLTLVSDGDGPIEAADVRPAFEGLADRTQYLAKLVRDGDAAVIAMILTDKVLGVKQVRSTTARTISATSYATLPTNGLAVQFTSVLVGDLFEVEISGQVNCPELANASLIAVVVEDSNLQLPETEFGIAFITGETLSRPPTQTRTAIYVSTLTGTVTFAMLGKVSAGANATLATAHTIRVRHTRPVNFTPSLTTAGA